MYKISTLPQVTSPISELADYLEIHCVLSDTGTYSVAQARSSVGMPAEESDIEGVISEEDRLYDRFYEALGEIDERKKRCRAGYPFSTTKGAVEFHGDESGLPYLMMLFATRMNMRDDSVAGGVDGTKLFEHISAAAAENYFGPERAVSSVFGTGREDNASMNDRVDSMLKEFREPYVFKEPEGGTGRYQDGKLDVVVRIPFADGRRDMFIGFGQCKTGTNWESTLTQLRPDVFFSIFATGSPCFTPVRLFFVAEACSGKWEEIVRNAGLFFDRCRIMDCLPPELPEKMASDTCTWVRAVIGKYSEK